MRVATRHIPGPVATLGRNLRSVLPPRRGRRRTGWIPVDERGPEHVCPHALYLSPVERLVLGLLPDAGRRPPSAIRCLNPSGHSGRHVSDAVESVGTELVRWVEWGGRRRTRIFDRPCCGAGLLADEWCFLPYRHHGQHSYAYLPLDLCWWQGGEVVWLAADDWLHRPDPGEGG